MKYEIHITVRPDVPIIPFADWCFEIGGKPLFIAVPGAKQSFQPMLSYRVDTSSERVAIETYKEFHLKATNWGVTRCKLECEDLWGPADYFEGHWHLDSYAIARQYLNTHKVSRNAVTPRFYLTRRGATAISDDFAGKFKFHSERVVLDTHLGIDDGWL